ncbi:MAG: DUF2064 domain-containing protein, partial [Bacteroidota bacterium]
MAKRFVGSKHPQTTNKSIAKFLIRKTVRIAEATELPILLINERRQVGKTFGQRICHAIEQVFDRGFERVIVLGNDTPKLEAATITHVANLLERQSMVLGPSPDGGLYLIGLNRDHFKRAIWEQFSWETNQLQLDFQNLDQSLQWLERLSDIDSAADFFRYYRSLEWASGDFQNLQAILDQPVLIPYEV